MATVGIMGAGTMGAGIAQIAAQAGWNVRLLDVSEEVVRKALSGIGKNYERLVEKGRLTAAQCDAARTRLFGAATAADFADCELIIEAVVEDLDVKVRMLGAAAAAAPSSAILASNTSSLSITKIGQGIRAGRRTVGMHFFNPVPLLPLVEVIAGDESEPVAVQRVFDIATAWGKTAVRAKDTPGFIVNRVARGFYLESLRLLGEGVAGVDEIDRIVKHFGGFRMGPFELMDMIGIDVNYTVSCSVYEQMGKPARLAPHHIQRELMAQKHLGRKTGRGYYSYAHEPPVPAVPVNRRTFQFPQEVLEAVRRVCDAATQATGSLTEQYVFARILVTVINEAALAVDDEIASAADIDTAMKLATSYPQGPLAWAEKIGRHTCATLLRRMNETVRDGRFASADWLQA